MTIRIVTDSVSDLPPDIAAEHNITVIPAYINIGEKSYLDGIDISRETFYKELPNYPAPPTTAAPSPGAFTEIYNKLAGEGATEILSIHVASSLSGIFNAARVGGEATDAVDVTAFDSQQVTMGLGLLTINAAEAAAAGASRAEIIALLEEQVKRTYVFGILDTLEYLRRSGRVNWAEFGIGTLLRIKPLVKVYAGIVEMPEKIRTKKRAMEYLLQKISNLGQLENMAIMYIGHKESADELRLQIPHLIPPGQKLLEVELTPALGAHIGPGGLGIACLTKNLQTN